MGTLFHLSKARNEGLIVGCLIRTFHLYNEHPRPSPFFSKRNLSTSVVYQTAVSIYIGGRIEVICNKSMFYLWWHDS